MGWKPVSLRPRRVGASGLEAFERISDYGSSSEVAASMAQVFAVKGIAAMAGGHGLEARVTSGKAARVTSGKAARAR